MLTNWVEVEAAIGPIWTAQRGDTSWGRKPAKLVLGILREAGLLPRDWVDVGLPKLLASVCIRKFARLVGFSRGHLGRLKRGYVTKDRPTNPTFQSWCLIRFALGLGLPWRSTETNPINQAPRSGRASQKSDMQVASSAADPKSSSLDGTQVPHLRGTQVPPRGTQVPPSSDPRLAALEAALAPGESELASEMHALELGEMSAQGGAKASSTCACPLGHVEEREAGEREKKSEKDPLTASQSDYSLDRLDVSEANGVVRGVDVGRDLKSELDDEEEPDLEGLQQLFSAPPARTTPQPRLMPARGEQPTQLSGHVVPLEICQYMLQSQAGAMQQTMGTLQRQMAEVVAKQADAMERQGAAIVTALDRQLGLTQRVLEKLDRPAPELKAPAEASFQNRMIELAIRAGEKFFGVEDPTAMEVEDE